MVSRSPPRLGSDGVKVGRRIGVASRPFRDFATKSATTLSQHGALCIGILVLGSNISRGSANGQERNYRREINARGPTKQLYSSFFAVLFPVMEIMGRSEGESRFSKRRNNTGIEIEREDSKVLGNFGFETLKFIGMLWIVMFFIHLTILVKYPKRSGNWDLELSDKCP